MYVLKKKISLHLDPHNSSLCCSRVSYISSYIILIRMQSSGTELIVEQSREKILSYLLMNSKWPRNSCQFLTQWLWGINEGFLYKITLHCSYLYGFYLLSLERFLLMQFVSRVILFYRTTIRSHVIRGLAKVIWKIYIVTNKEKMTRNILYHSGRWIQVSCSKWLCSLSLKGNQPWIFVERTDAEVEAPILWPPDAKSRFIRKDPDAGEDWGQKWTMQMVG